MKIFLSVGHSILKGGGCTSASGYTHEYRYNKELASYVKRALESLGHSCDVIVCPEGRFTNWKQEASYKLPIANSGKYDLVCELHLNASNGQGQGSEVLHYPGDRKGQEIATRGSSALSKLGFKNRGPKSRGDLYIIGSTRPTAVLFESFFCDSKHDSDLAKKLGFKKIAEAIAYGLTGQVVDSDVEEVEQTTQKVIPKSGWIQENGKWYYYDNNRKRTGWLKSGKQWFYLQPKDGEMATGWLKYNSHWFYFNSKGYMLTGKQTIDGKTYEFNKDGYLIK
jgi:N-acetylmuramoyl-L-alanine amidase